tara:strand:- start:9722 stop:10444 length:723 start_codon:yes stop_codon:yes gene_type:complete
LKGIKALIVDDEPLARNELIRLLKAHPHIEVVSEAVSGSDAIQIIDRQNIDLVFLDINMPGLSGLQIARNIKNINFIFCTAYIEYAVDAFELNAIDYLLKPIEPSRLSQAIDKVEQNQNILAAQPNDDNNIINTLLLKTKGHFKLVNIDEIFRIESIGNHVALYYGDEKAYLHSSLSNIEKKICPSKFIKASRSDIIRINYISHIEEGIQSATMVAILNNGSEIAISRRQVQSLRKQFSI